MATGLPVSRLINVSVTIDPTAAGVANFNSLVIVGDSDVIDTDTRIIRYGSLTEVGAAFGTSAEEYKAALLWFSQSPKPTDVYIGKWAQAATKGRLIGAALTAAQQALSNFTSITNGALKLTIDGSGSPTTITGLNFSAATSMTNVASIINTALSTAATCTWDGSRFIIKSSTTGASSAVAFPVAPGSGTDIKAVVGLTSAQGARTVAGIAAETALAAIQAIDATPTFVYGVTFASTNLVDNDRVAIADYVEASSRPHIYGATTNASATLDSAQTTDIASVLKAAGYKRSLVQYSRTTPYAVCSLLARVLTTDFTAQNSTITLMYKGEPAVTAETLTTAQADALKTKRANVFVNYDNSTAIIQYGTMAGDAYIDEIVGLDWLTNAVQTAVFNRLYSSKKVPQTDAGAHLLVNAAESALDQGVNNGLLAPGYWTNDGFGEIDNGSYLTKGYYVYAPALRTQSQADRAARKSVPIQIAAKLAGAVHTVDVSITVNR